MFTSKPKKLTDFSRVFLEPSNATPRQYEALRAFFVEGLPSAEAARRSVHPGELPRPRPPIPPGSPTGLLLTPAKGPQSAPKTDPLRDRIIALRKQNLSIYDISRNLAHQGHPLSQVAVARVLKDEGSLACRAGPTRNAHPARGPPRPMSPMSATRSEPRWFEPNSAACSSSRRCCPRSPSIASSRSRDSPDRR